MTPSGRFGEGEFQPDAFSVVRTQPFSVVGIQPDVFSVDGVESDGPQPDGPHTGAHEVGGYQSGGGTPAGGQQPGAASQAGGWGGTAPQAAGSQGNGATPPHGGQRGGGTAGGAPAGDRRTGAPYPAGGPQPDPWSGAVPPASGYRANGAASPSGYDSAGWQVGGWQAGGWQAGSTPPGGYQSRAPQAGTTPQPDGWRATQSLPSHHQTDGWGAGPAQPGGPRAPESLNGNANTGGLAAADGSQPDPWSAGGPVRWATQRRAFPRRFGRGRAAYQESPDMWAAVQPPWSDEQTSDPAAQRIRARRNRSRRGDFRLEKPGRRGFRRSRASRDPDDLASYLEPRRRWFPLAAISAGVVAILGIVIVAGINRTDATNQVTPNMGTAANTPGAATNTPGPAAHTPGAVAAGGATTTAPMADTQAGAAVAQSGQGAATPIVNVTRRTVNGQRPTVNLTDLHASDWLHFGSLATPMQVEHAAGGHGLPYTFATIGGTAHTSRANVVRYTWRDGTHTARFACSTTEIFVSGRGSGFRMVVPVPAKPATLMLYVGSVRGAARLRIAADTGQVKHDTLPGNPHGAVHVVYTVMLRPAANAKTVEITWTTPAEVASGSVVLESAALLLAG